jgi:PEP-CTERM motif
MTAPLRLSAQATDHCASVRNGPPVVLVSRLKGLVCAAGLLAGPVAQALTISTEFGLPTSLASATITSGSLSYFDPQLGTLTGARLELFSSYSGVAVMRDRDFGGFGQARSDGDVKGQVLVNWDSTHVPLMNTLTAAERLVATGPTFPPPVELHYEATGLWKVPVPAAASSEAPISGSGFRAFDLAPILSSLQGQGSFSLGNQVYLDQPFRFTSHTPRESSGVVVNFVTDSLYGTGARLTYTYTAAPVPEPGTSLLSVAGLVLVGALVKRQRGAAAAPATADIG